jgi:exonuclease III
VRFVTWNLGRSRRTHAAAWHYLLDCLKPDIAFVQEALASAEDIVRAHGPLVWHSAKSGGTGVFIRRGIEFSRFDASVNGSYVVGVSTAVLGRPTNAVSVHVGPEKWANQKSLRSWMVDQLLPAGCCVIGGDLNASRSFSQRHRDYLSGLSVAGFHDCHWSKHQRERPSFWGRQGVKEYQDDHFFTDQSLARSIRACEVVDNALTRLLSDHGPLTLDLDESAD